MDIDDSFKELNSLVAEYGEVPSYSEADTRSKLIDRILIKCLGWSESQITREDHVNVGYIDYTLQFNNVPMILIEAKKTDVEFEIPKTINKRNYKIGGVIKSIPALLSAIRQVRAYCFEIGVKFAVVSNGHQFVVFPTFSSGKKWEETNCVVFTGLVDIQRNFVQFWNILNSDCIENGSLAAALENSRTVREYKKIISEIHNPSQTWERNTIYTHLQPLVDFIFTELLEETKIDVLKNCYVYDRSNRNLGDEIDGLFIDKMPFFANRYKIKDIFEREVKAGVFQKELDSLISENRELPLSVLLGGIGAGKSTFIHRFFKIVLDNRETLQWYYIDFRHSSFDQNHIEDYIYATIYSQFKGKYESRVSGILEKSGFNVPIEDKKIFCLRLIGFLLAVKIPVVLVIDNVDQHEYQFQERLFIISNHICKELKAITILALREETFLISTRTGVFDAYHIPKFHIASPNFISILKARIDFTIKFLRQPDVIESYRIDEETGKQLIHFFEILKRSFAKDNEQSRKIVHFYDTISVGNMREALRMFNSFLTSGNTNVEDMFERELDDRDTFQIAFHQMLKSIILGEHRFYSSERSHITNLFDFDTSISDSHFNQLRVLNYLKLKENSKSQIGRGYVDLNELFFVAGEIVISKPEMIDSMKRLVQFNLIQLDNQSVNDIENARYATITHAGKLYLEELVFQFGYIEPISLDTPISDKNIFTGIIKLINDGDLHSRLLRAALFIRYLSESETREKNEKPQYMTNQFGNFYIMQKVRSAFNSLVDSLAQRRIINSAEEYRVSS